MSQSRARAADLRDLLAGSPVPRGSGATGYLGRVVDSGAMPATVPGVYLTRAKRILGGSPGDSPTSSVDDGEGATLTPVLVIGGTVPVAGMDLEAWPVGGTLVSSGGRPCSTATIRVKGCGNGNFPGAWVEVSLDGSVIAEGYSTSSPGGGGVLTFTAPGPGEYSARAKHYRFSDQPSATFEITQCGSIPSTVLQFTTPKDGFACTLRQSAVSDLGGWPLPDEMVAYKPSVADGNAIGELAPWTFRKQSGDPIWLSDAITDGTHPILGAYSIYAVFRADITTASGVLYTSPYPGYFPGFGAVGFGVTERRPDTSTSSPIDWGVNGLFSVPTINSTPPLDVTTFILTYGLSSPPPDWPAGAYRMLDTITGDSAAEPWLDD